MPSCAAWGESSLISTVWIFKKSFETLAVVAALVIGNEVPWFESPLVDSLLLISFDFLLDSFALH